MTTLFRFRFEILGGHTHVGLWAGRREAALGKCGNLVFRNEEWDEFRKAIALAALAPRMIQEGTAFQIVPDARPTIGEK